MIDQKNIDYISCCIPRGIYLLYLFGIFSLLMLFFLTYTIHSFFRITQSSSRYTRKYLSSEEILPLKLINKKVSSIFPRDVANQLKENKNYIWLTSTCPSCNEEFEMLNSDKNLSSDIIGFLTDPQKNYPFRDVKSNMEMLTVSEYISTKEMGELFNLSPIYFSLDSKKKIKKISATHHPFK